MPETPSSERNLSVLVDDVHVTYKSDTDDINEVPPERRRMARIRRTFGRPYQAEVRALRGISFRAHEGENIGLVGSNGSGKSTLLRVIAGLESPTKGSVLATATPSLLGVSAALIPHLTGARNVEIGLLALGYTPEEAEELAPSVAELAGIGAAIHRPMNTYSSGMGARLRFAISTATKPEILLIDEALGTGDASFAARAERALDELRASAGTIFLVSHAAQTIEEMCSRAIWIHQGEQIADGDAKVVALHYRKWAWAIAQNKPKDAAKLFEEAKQLAS